MAADPVLVLQMQRMGDLILSFPLFLWLKRQFPDAEIRVVAEESFYKPLMAVSPPVTYIPWNRAQAVLGDDYQLALNLSIRPQAADILEQVKAQRKPGPRRTGSGQYVAGSWQLYRASLVNNNRYNRYHWADLNGLDVVDRKRMAATRYDPPRFVDPAQGLVGLFLGASEPAKHPTPAFWAGLIRALHDRGLRTVLLGGPAEKPLGEQVARAFGGPVTNYCGKLKLDELVRMGTGLSCLVTPDTGPMHLAAWTGTRTLNLSMGNVQPWETGPYQPGHWVLRSSLDCAVGCWKCTRDGLECHRAFAPDKVAYVASRLLAKGKAPARAPEGLRLWESGRDDLGLYHLKDLSGSPPTGQDRLGAFWKAVIALFMGHSNQTHAARAAEELKETDSNLAVAMKLNLPDLAKALARAAKAREFEKDFLKNTIVALRPLAGYAELLLQNSDFAPDTATRALDLVARTADLLN